MPVLMNNCLEKPKTNRRLLSMEKIKIYCLFASCLFLISSSAYANKLSKPSQKEEFAKNKNTTEVQSKQLTPQFKDYPVSSIYKGLAAKLVLDNNSAKAFEKQINQALAEDKIKFAGEYIIVRFSCGTAGCMTEFLVNKRTGKMLHVDLTSYLTIVDSKRNVEERVGETIESTMADSHLLVTREVTEGKGHKPAEYFNKFYILDQGKLKLIKKIKTMNN